MYFISSNLRLYLQKSQESILKSANFWAATSEIILLQSQSTYSCTTGELTKWQVNNSRTFNKAGQNFLYYRGAVEMKLKT